jgi:hypothetical protein
MFPISQSHRGNRFAIDRRSGHVVDLDCVIEKRWPAECLNLHNYSCREGYNQARFLAYRPRQADHADPDDIWDFLTRLGRAGRRESA